MKYLIITLGLLASSAFAADVGVSVNIGQPGFYGRIDIGDYPRPPLVYRQPRLVEHMSPRRPPIYLNVPPGHARNWRRYCRDYDACDERVYFVDNRWYTREYVPRYQAHARGRYEERRDARRDHRQTPRRGNGRDRDWEHGH